MMNKKHLLNICSIVLTLTFISSGTTAGTYAFKHDGTDTIAIPEDGPYVLHQKDGSTRIISVDAQGTLKDTTYRTLPENFSLSVSSRQGKYRFQVPLHPVKRPDWKYRQPRKVFVMSDPHGNLECFVSLLQGNGIIDKQFRWTFGSNHLMIVGDIFDRGDEVLQIFWLVYKLEHEAAEAGGHVSFLLGNHEAMVLSNDLRYCTPKYHALSDRLGIPYPRLFGENTELGRWLATRNTIVKIGKDLFVHAGISQEFYERNLSIKKVNREMSKVLFLSNKERKFSSEPAKFLYGSNGPLWYRGMVKKKDKYRPLPADTLQQLLKRYHAEHFIVGHTIFDDISTFYHRKVIDVNVNNVKNKEKLSGCGLLIEDNEYEIAGHQGILGKLSSQVHWDFF